jgi:hypothetical protein
MRAVPDRLHPIDLGQSEFLPMRYHSKYEMFDCGRNKMRMSRIIVAGLALSVAAWSAGLAATAAAPQGATSSSAAVKTAPAVSAGPDCQKTGGDVSALIDASATSPNISAAKAVFQLGIMDCMEGQPEEANKHYDDARKLLGSSPSRAPVSSSKP